MLLLMRQFIINSYKLFLARIAWNVVTFTRSRFVRKNVSFEINDHHHTCHLNVIMNVSLLCLLSNIHDYYWNKHKYTHIQIT
jgi:hypothetical protein